LAAILVESRDQRTQFWKGTTQESFQQSLVEIGSVVSEEKIFFKFHPPFFLICIIGQNRFQIVSGCLALHSRWPLLQKIEISSNGQNCSILSLNVPKFELYKHNDELFNMYYRIIYEL
jgi:UV DNA damage repair endonuclease